MALTWAMAGHFSLKMPPIGRRHRYRVAPITSSPATTPEWLSELRQARIILEMAADALDAEPPPRALSMLAYDVANGLYVLFGGDHFDFLRNDVWVFDPRVPRWQRRHTTGAPEGRADHSFISDGKGGIIMSGGFIHAQRNPLPPGWSRHAMYYVHAGPGEWRYDVAANRWSGPAEPPLQAANGRTYRSDAHVPEHYTAGERPDAAAHTQRLADLPVNTWVDLAPPIRFPGNRDWGTLGFDAKRDLIYFYNGGHSAYGGTDVARYHLAANRWDQPVEAEYPLGLIGASGRSLPGQSFNRRPWMTNHLWNSYRFHPSIDRLLVAGRFTSSGFRHLGMPDSNSYLYDPDFGDWLPRLPSSVALSCMNAQLCWVPGFGMIEWGRWRFDDKALDWVKLEPKGSLPPSHIDHCGLVHDAPRNRVLYFSGGGYGGPPYAGGVVAMDIPSLEVSTFTPANAERIAELYLNRRTTGTWTLREMVHHPAGDLLIFSSHIKGDYSVALDLKNQRWVGLRLPGPHPVGHSSAMVYDSKRDLIYAVGTRAHVSALRLDPQGLVIKSLSEVADEAAALAAAVKQ